MNSTLGLGGFFDVAKNAGLPPHFNDMGLTFAKWGDKKSNYLVIPLLGPSTFRDATGLTFDYSIFMPYPYLSNNALMYSLLGLRYVDLRAQMLDNEKLFEEAIDQYAFLRDAYLQHRNYLINGDSPQDNGELYVDEEDETDEALLNEGTDDGKKSLTPLTTSQNDSYRTLPARDSALYRQYYSFVRQHWRQTSPDSPFRLYPRRQKNASSRTRLLRMGPSCSLCQ
jgi:hypothetical protein